MLTLVAGLPLAWAIGRFRFRGRSLARALVLVPFVLPTVVVATAFLELLPDGSSAGCAGDPRRARLLQRRGRDADRRRRLGDARPAQRRGGGRARRRAAATGARGDAALSSRRRSPRRRARPSSSASRRSASSSSSAGRAAPRVETEIYNQAARLFDLQAAAALVAAAARRGRDRARRREHAGGARRRAATLADEKDVLRRPAGPRAARPRRRARRWRRSSSCSRSPSSCGARSGAGARSSRRRPRCSSSPWRAAEYSLAFATTAAAIALVVGGLAAIALARRPPGVVDGLVLLPLGASAVMLGFGFIITFDEPPVDFRSSWWLVPVAQSLVAAPFVVRIVTPALRSIDPRLREAAATLGASPSRAWREVDLPLVVARLRGRRGLRLRDRARRVRRHGLRRPRGPAHPAGRDLPLPRPPGRPSQGTAAALSVVLAAITVCTALAAESLARGRGRGL